MAKHPTRVIEKAVRGMLPKSRLGKKLFTPIFCLRRLYTSAHGTITNNHYTLIKGEKKCQLQTLQEEEKLQLPVSI
jgi:hypothetical protein